MLSKDGRKVLCDVRGCGKEAARGCEVRIDAGHGGDHITIPGDLMRANLMRRISLKL